MPSTSTMNVVQNVGDITIQYAHHNIRGGIAMKIGGFRLQGEFLSMNQIVDNSVLVPLLGGGSVQLTNTNNSGQISFNSIRTGLLDKNGDPAALDENGFITTNLADAFYDISSIADALRNLTGGDGVGGTFLIESAFNGNTFRVKLIKATLVRSPLFIASGTDTPNYVTTFNYAKPIVDPASDTAANDAGNELFGQWTRP